MNIVFYSTTTDRMYPLEEKSEVNFPTKASAWDELAARYPEQSFFVVSEDRHRVFYDLDPQNPAMRAKNVRYVNFELGTPVQQIAGIIEALAPDVAIGVPSRPGAVDWETLRDAEIADLLRKKGINAVCHTINTGIAFMDKWRSHYVLRQLGFGVAKALYVQNNMMQLEKSNPEIVVNAYKEYVLYRVEEMHFPVIIKATTGAGSLGLQVVDSFEQAKALLTDERNDADVLVEEFIQGDTFGLEIHGVPGRYSILPPVMFSTNQEGITDQFQSVKLGPVTNEKYGIPALQESLRTLAETFELAGSAQVDLVFRDNKWYIIEINPRWSGQTNTLAYAMEGRSPYQMYYESALKLGPDYSLPENITYGLDFKAKGMDAETYEKVTRHPGVKCVTLYGVKYMDDLELSEIVLGGYTSRADVLEGLRAFVEAFPGLVPAHVPHHAQALVARI